MRRLRQAQRVQKLGAAGAEQVAQGRDLPALAEHRVQAGFLGGAHLDQLVPVTHQLPQLAQFDRGDVGLREPAQPQQIHQLTGVRPVGLTRRSWKLARPFG
jgi:hypothetical protein